MPTYASLPTIPGFLNPQEMTGGSVNPENWGDTYMDKATGEKYVSVRGTDATQPGTIAWFSAPSDQLNPWQQNWKQYLAPYVNAQGLVPVSKVHEAESRFPMPVDSFDALSYGPLVLGSLFVGGLAAGGLAGAAGAGAAEGLGAGSAIAAGEGLGGSGLAAGGGALGGAGFGGTAAEALAAGAYGNAPGMGLEGYFDLLKAAGETGTEFGNSGFSLFDPSTYGGGGQFQGGGGMFDEFFDLGNFNPFESLDPTYNPSNAFQLSDPYGTLPANLGGTPGLNAPFQPNFNLLDPSTYSIPPGSNNLNTIQRILRSLGLPGGDGNSSMGDNAGTSNLLRTLLGSGGAAGLLGPLLQGGGSIAGALLANDAAKRAADAQIASTNAAIGEQRRQYDVTRADQEPWRAAGGGAIGQLSGLTQPGGELYRRFTTADLNADPVYQSGLQFGLNQGRDALNARAIAAGNYDSGAALKALTRFGTDYGATKGNEAYNRFTNDQTNLYNRLAGVAGVGQTANQQIQSAGSQAANQISNQLTDAGNARAARIVGGSNAFGQGLQGVTGAFNQYQNQYQGNEILDRLLKSQGY